MEILQEPNNWTIDDYIECLENEIYFCESEDIVFHKNVIISSKMAKGIVKLLKELKEGIERK